MKKNIIGNISGGGGTAALRFWHDESGQGLVEYVVILAVISLATTLGLTSLGKSTNNDITELQGGLDPEASEVVFETEDGERLNRGFYSSYNPIVIPEVPDKAGTSGKYWSLDGETIATEEDIRAAAAMGGHVTLQPVYTVNLTVTGAGFKISGFEDDPDGSVVRTYLSREAIVGKTYSLTFCSEETFLYWKEYALFERLVSKNSTYNVILATDKNITAVSKNAEDTGVEVHFINSYKQIFSSHIYSKSVEANDIEIPTKIPVLLGRTFLGWVVPGYEATKDTETLQANIAAVVNSTNKNFIEVTDKYANPDQDIRIRLYVDGIELEDEIWAAPGFYTYTLNTTKHVKWYLGEQTEENLIAVKSSVSYQLTGLEEKEEGIRTVRLFAVTSDTASTNGNAIIQKFFSQNIGTEESPNYKMFVIGNYSLPEGATKVERGILYSITPKGEDTLTTQYIKNGVSCSKDGSGDGTYVASFNMSNPQTHDRELYVRAYLVYNFNGEAYTVYSDVMSGSYNSTLVE